MKSRLIASSLVISLVLFVAAQFLVAAPSDWEMVGAGIGYQEFLLEDPNHVYVARLERNNPAATLESGIATGSLVSGIETVSQLGERYDQALSYWGGSWGSRNKVVVAVNGFYFTGGGLPISGQVTSGWYAKRFDDMGGGSGFAWKLDRSAFIGGCVYHRPEKQILQFPSSGSTLEFNGINVPRQANELVIYTPQYDKNTRTDNTGLEVLVELTKPAMIQPPPAYVTGYVREIRDGQGSTLIPFDHVVLSAHGTARDALRRTIRVGDEIGLSQEITSYASDCETPLEISWTKTYASIGGSYVFLANGQVQDSDDKGAVDRHPRTAIAYNDEFIYFIVVDGRYPDVSIGMTIKEVAAFAKGTLNATWGIALDGGGSSTMVVNGEVKNQPTDPCFTVYIPQVQKGGILGTEGWDNAQPKGKPGPIRLPGCQRRVANGMMMVNVQLAEYSHALKPSDKVVTSQPAELRLGPGNNYPVLAQLPAGATGIVLHHFNNLDGVLATGSYWWKVAVKKMVGWISQDALKTDNPAWLDPLVPR